VIAVTASIIHTTLNKIIVGKVFFVDDHINAALEITAKI
jgi:hypothetical protein